MDIDPKVKALIDDAKATALGITDIDRDSIISLLSIEPGSKECEYLGRAARDVARINNKNQAKVELPSVSICAHAQRAASSAPWARNGISSRKHA